MKRESKADQQVVRDEADATARETERQFDRELEASLNKQAALERPKLTLWQRFLAWVDRVA